jgi:hypothetical protein
LPLDKGNSWDYSFTSRDSTTGAISTPNRLRLHLEITGCFGLKNDSSLVTLDRNNYQSFSSYAYQFEWENTKTGNLIVYHDLYPLATRGLYIIGAFNGLTTTLYKTEQLWLAYPADSGKSWHFHTSGDTTDTTDIVSMQILSTNAQFLLPDAQSPSGTTAITCYLYKETAQNYASYYYYNQNWGCVGYQYLQDGNIRETYILTNFNRNNGYLPD